MRDILKHLPILKAGTSKENYPLYAQLLHSEGGYVSTCDDSGYVRMKFDMVFEGNVNIFVLENVLKILPDEYGVDVTGNIVKIKTNKLNYDLKFVPMSFFPSMEEPDTEYMEIDEGILAILKTALAFTGANDYESVYFDDKGMLATNGQKILKYDGKSSLSKPVLLSRKIISLLQVGNFIGSDDNDNTVVKFPGGFAVFVSPHYSSFPCEKIREFSIPLLEDTKKLIDIGTFKDSLSKVIPIFFGESKRIVQLNNNDIGKLEICGESPFNGKAGASVKSELNEEFTILMDADLFNAVPDGYDLHIKDGVTDRLMAKNHSSEVILVGE